MTEFREKILALSGAHELLLAAVQNGKIFTQAYNQGFQHNEQMVALCQQLLEKAGLELCDLQALAVDLGPGSFTGQRISLSFAKGLSFALNKPLIGFDTFVIWRHSFLLCYGQDYLGERPLCVLIDGRKRRFYARLFIEGRKNRSLDLSSQQLYRELQENYDADFLAKLCIIGPGSSMFLEELASQGCQIESIEHCAVIDEAALAASMLELASQQYQKQNFMKASDGPLYLRQSDAEERLLNTSAKFP